MVCWFCCQMSAYVAILHVAAAVSVKCTNDCGVGFSYAILQGIEMKYVF